MFWATVVALTARPDIPIREAAASLTNRSLCTFLFLFAPYRPVEAARYGFPTMISGGDYREAFFMFSATLRVPALTPDIPIKAAAANLMISFILCFYSLSVVRFFSNYFEAAEILRAATAAETATPDIPAKEAAAKAIQCFIWVP